MSLPQDLVLEPTGDIIEGDKRQYAPWKLSWTCSKCGTKCVNDFGTRYLSYPQWGQPRDYTLHCPECDFEEPIQILPQIVLSVVQPTLVREKS